MVQYRTGTTASLGKLIRGWTPGGKLGDPDMHEHENVDIDGRLLYWQNCEGRKVGIARCEAFEDDGFPWVALKYEESVTGEEGWRHTDICRNRQAARKAAAKKADHFEYMDTKNPAETYTEWLRRTGGTTGSLNMSDSIVTA
jgi:hypothetical protein